MSKTILIIEDEADIRLLYAEVLRDAGYNVHEAADGTTGLEKALKEDWELLLLDIVLPVKVELTVTNAPPAVKGNTAQGGLKQVILETGLQMNVPMFINEGDVLRINTESGAYVERVSK